MEKRFFTPWRIGLILIFALSILIYLPSLMGSAIWDDDDLLSGAAFGGNNLLSAFTHPFLGHYFRPLTSASFAIDSSFANGTPFFYHQTNILLHAITAILVAILGSLVTEKKLAGFFAGLFFAAQPLQVGATAWIGGRTDVLSACFLSAFMVSLVRYHQTNKPSILYVSAFLYLLAALSKEQAAAILPAVPLSVFVFGSKKWKDVWRICIPFGVAILVYIVMWIIDAPAPYGASNGLIDTVLLGCRTAMHYGSALLMPNHNSLLTFTLENYTGVPYILIGACFVLGYFGFLYLAWKGNRPVFWVGICALLVYLPISNFPTVPSFVVGPYRFAEAGTGAACLLGNGLASALSGKKYLLTGLMCANLVAAAAVTWWGAHQWMTPLQLFKSAAEIDRHFIIGVGNYSHALDLESRSSEALRMTDETMTWILGTKDWVNLLETKKRGALSKEVLTRLRTNGGIPDVKAFGWFISCNAASLSKLKRLDDARRIQKLALMIAPRDARINYGYAQLIIDIDRKSAVHYMEVAMSISPKYSACAMSLAHERVIDKRYPEAIHILDKAMKDIGWNGNAWLDYADAKIGIGDVSGAEKALFEAENSLFKASKNETDKRRKVLAAMKQHSR